MRFIKFKAWNSERKEIYHPSSFQKTSSNLVVYDGQFRGDELIQFTNLFDKNNKEIYEDDIIQCPTTNPFQNNIFYVAFFKGMFIAVWDLFYKDNYNAQNPMHFIDQFDHYCCAIPLYSIADQYEVVGNIYENEEMITQQKGINKEKIFHGALPSMNDENCYTMEESSNTLRNWHEIKKEDILTFSFEPKTENKEMITDQKGIDKTKVPEDECYTIEEFSKLLKEWDKEVKEELSKENKESILRGLDDMKNGRVKDFNDLNEETKEKLLKGLDESKKGKSKYVGSFKKYIEDDNND